MKYFFLLAQDEGQLLDDIAEGVQVDQERHPGLQEGA